MQYKLEMTKEDGHLLARARGQRSLETVVAVAKEVVGACAKHGYDKVLVDVQNLEGQMGVFDAYAIPAEHFPLLKQLGVLKKAVIVDSEKRRERYVFFESVARGRGFNFRAFSDTDAAVKWLLSEDEELF
jgi:hypothetical protein